VKFAVYGTCYEIPEPDDLSTRELRDVKKHTGMGLRGFAEGLNDMDPDSITAIVYLAKKRAGEALTWDSLDELRPMKDVEWPTEPEGEAEASPEIPELAGGSSPSGGTSREAASTATWPGSPTTSGLPLETSTTSP
jgi:hypothetical protein